MHTRKTQVRTYYCCGVLDDPGVCNKQNSRLLHIQLVLTDNRTSTDVSVLTAYYPYSLKLSRFHKQDNIVTLKRFPYVIWLTHTAMCTRITAKLRNIIKN